MTNSWLKNERITLRSPEPEDLELLYRMENDSTLWSIGSTTLPYSRYTLRRYLEQSTQDLYAERQARFIIALDDGSRAGMIDLADFSPLHARAEVCIGLLSEYRHKGVASEALELLAAYALHFLNLHQLYAYVPADNAQSIALFRRAGFKETATLKEWLKQDSGHRDVKLFQLIKE